MDELLQRRVLELREIDDRLDRIRNGFADSGQPLCSPAGRAAIAQLSGDLAVMIWRAEAEHAAF